MPGQRCSKVRSPKAEIRKKTVVYPAAGLPFTALQAGATVVEVNPEATPLTPQASLSIRGLSGEVLPALVAATWG